MRRLLAVALGAALVPVAAHAQQAKIVQRHESKLIFEMPGLESNLTTHQYFGWTPNYSHERTYVFSVPRAGSYPRAQVILDVLSKSYVWTHARDMNEAWLKGSWPFFKDRAITITQAPPNGSNDTRRIVRFQVDNADCVGFSLGEFSIGYAMETPTSAGAPRVTGFYCGTIGGRMSDDDVKAVLAGWRYYPNGGAPAASPVNAQQQPSLPPGAIPFSGFWEGVGQITNGALEAGPEPATGSIMVTLAGDRCTGTWRRTEQFSTGMAGEWAAVCTSGASTNGTYRYSTQSRRGVGSGVDAQGRKIDLNIGF